MVAYNLDSAADEQACIAEIRALADAQFSATLDAAGPAYLTDGRKRAEQEVARWLERFSRARRYPAPATAQLTRQAHTLFLDVFADQWDSLTAKL
jgi:hypothetical protein